MWKFLNTNNSDDSDGDGDGDGDDDGSVLCSRICSVVLIQFCCMVALR